MHISLASSRENGYLRWSKNHPNITLAEPPETACCSVNEFGERVEAEIPRLRRYARALTRNSTAADDLVQDSIERSLAKRRLWRPETNLRAWLFTIMHNQYVNQVRRSVREGVAISISDSEPSMTREASQGKRLELRDLDRALARLPDEQRSVILLVGLEGMSYEAVAEVVGIPVGTVRSRLSRGRAALRQLMDDLTPNNQTKAVVAHVVTTTTRFNNPGLLAAY
jgi:RNA polymerase sigma-70 factor (ECF subfamily)